MGLVQFRSELSKSTVAKLQQANNRTKSNFYTAIQKQNAIVRSGKPDKAQQAHFLSSMNSYLGILKHYKTHKLRKRLLFKNLSARWWNCVYLSGGIAKFVLKTKTVKQSDWRQ